MMYEDRSHAGRTLKLDDVSLMLYGESGHFGYLAEMEANDVYREDIGGPEADETVHDHFHIERLYIDYTFDETYTLRGGKFNSPIGFWNLTPINVLRDTTSNPVVTEILFPRFTTGVDLQYNDFEHATTMDLMLQATKDMDTLLSREVYNNVDLNRHFALGLSGNRENWSYHLNGGYFRLVDEKSYYYLCASAQYLYRKWKVQGEVGSRFDKEKAVVPYVGYLQLRYRIQEGHDAIVRVESYDNRQKKQRDTFGVFAYTYRPWYPVAIKGEYQWHAIGRNDRFLLSFSMLF
ncbi:hypothetical protein [Hydrogenimonas urashimensis]|uniref:hypothetical protein n=1 Tax=Hydrogenimonas urashimensis TaxID=2740515 RepID=UPI0019164E16|nr:hypothetical protein [Hydrogenimonas urashimensis]